MANSARAQGLVLFCVTTALCLVLAEGQSTLKFKKYNRTKYYVALGMQPPAVSNQSSSVDVNVALNVAGIFPGLTATANSGAPRSECGIGALMPWADRLYMVSYLSVPNAGHGTGLYEIYSNMSVS